TRCYRDWSSDVCSSDLPLPIPIPLGATFDLVDLENQDAVNELAKGCGLILHFGGISTEQSFETVLGPNLRGSFHIYEAARSQNRSEERRLGKESESQCG